jgi:hypothetical protein
MDRFTDIFDKDFESRMVQCYTGFRAEIKENPAASKTFRFALDEEDAYELAAIWFSRATLKDDGTILDVPAVFGQHRIRPGLFAMYRREARELVAKHWPAILKVADLLMEKWELSGAEVAAIVNDARAGSSS